MKKTKVLMIILILGVLGILFTFLSFQFLFTYPHLEQDKYLMKGISVTYIPKGPSFHGDGMEIRESKFISKEKIGRELLKKGWKQGRKMDIPCIGEDKELKKVVERINSYEDEDTYWYYMNTSPYGEDNKDTGNWIYYVYNKSYGIFSRIIYDT
ncbi:MAG: hypothetical protein Q4Q07_03090 [Tissierellia bacterium]|nr:hypothetical protein [Tissierellia bacterium]